MTRRPFAATLLPAALAALLLAPGLASARGAPASTDEARLQAAAEVVSSAPAVQAVAGPIASTDLARAAASAAPRIGQAMHAVKPAGPIQSTDDARALAAARTEGAMVAMAAGTDR